MTQKSRVQTSSWPGGKNHVLSAAQTSTPCRKRWLDTWKERRQIGCRKSVAEEVWLSKKTLDCFIIGKSLHRYWNWLKEGWSELSQYQTILSLLVSTTNKSTLRYLRSLLAALLSCVPRLNQASRSKSMGDQFSDSGTNMQWEIESRSVSKTLAHSCYFQWFHRNNRESQRKSQPGSLLSQQHPSTI